MSGINKFAVLKEFPFLSQYCNTAELKNACVKRCDEEVLALTPMRQSEELDHYSPMFAKTCLVDEQGSLVVQVGQGIPLFLFKPWAWFLRQFPRGLRRDSPTPGDIFYILESEVQRVHYVVDIYDGILTLYKPPKGFKTIGNWLVSRAEELKDHS